MDLINSLVDQNIVVPPSAKSATIVDAQLATSTLFHNGTTLENTIPVFVSKTITKINQIANAFQKTIRIFIIIIPLK